jgi:Transposase zinc-ribbon domain
MFVLSAVSCPVLRWRQGPVMSGFLTFMDRYRDEAACIAALAELRWSNGFICAGCAGRLAYQLAARPRVLNVPTAGGSIR